MSTKVLVQLLLSMLVGVSAAIGFAPNAVKIREEVKASLRERVNIVLPSIGGLTTQLKANTSVSAQTQVKAVIQESTKVDAKLRSNLNARVISNHGTNVLNNINLSPDVSLDGSAPINAQTNIGTNTQTSAGTNLPGADLDAKNTLKTNLDLNLFP